MMRDHDPDEPLFEGWEWLGFGAMRCLDPNVSLWFLRAPGIVMAWSPKIHWWRVDLVRLLWWEFQP